MKKRRYCDSASDEWVLKIRGDKRNPNPGPSPAGKGTVFFDVFHRDSKDMGNEKSFNEEGQLAIDRDRWDLPVGYVVGLVVAVVAAPENADEQLLRKATVHLMGEQFQVNELWGKREMLRRFIAGKLNQPRLFEGDA